MSQVGNPQFEKKAVLFWVGCSILLVGRTKVGLKFHKGLHCTLCTLKLDCTESYVCSSVLMH